MSVENGFVPTPASVADLAAASTFAVDRPGHLDSPNPGRILLPGLGTGRLYDAVRRYCTAGEGWTGCRSFDYPMPDCIGVEMVSDRVTEFEETHPDADLEIRNTDFLLESAETLGTFDWVVANPPYVRYRDIDAAKRDQYRDRYRLAAGQFDLFVPFIEQSLWLLKPGGWAVFILPVQVLGAPMFEPLRTELRMRNLGPIWQLPPQTFDNRVQPVMIGVRAGAYEHGSPNRPLWLEALREMEVREVLEGLDTDVDDLDAAVDRYYEEYEHTDRLLRFTDSRERKQQSGGHQSGLEQFAGGESA